MLPQSNARPRVLLAAERYSVAQSAQMQIGAALRQLPNFRHESMGVANVKFCSNALRQKTLKVVPAPLIEAVPSAPPALETPNPTAEFRCGNCAAVLMRWDEGKVYPLMVRCVCCGSYNATDV
jgi:hypothetical protein